MREASKGRVCVFFLGILRRTFGGALIFAYGEKLRRVEASGRGALHNPCVLIRLGLE